MTAIEKLEAQLRELEADTEGIKSFTQTRDQRRVETIRGILTELKQQEYYVLWNEKMFEFGQLHLGLEHVTSTDTLPVLIEQESLLLQRLNEGGINMNGFKLYKASLIVGEEVKE